MSTAYLWNFKMYFQTIAENPFAINVEAFMG